MRMLLALAALVVLGASLAVLLLGRESDSAVSLGRASNPPSPNGDSTTSGRPGEPTGAGPAPATVSLQVWFTRGGLLVPQLRSHRATPQVATAALRELLAGPTRAEAAAGLATAVPSGTRLLGISIARGVATVDLTSEYESGGGSRSLQTRLAQVVYTLTEFPTVKAVRFELDGAPVNVFSGSGIVLDHPVRRSDYRSLTAIGPPLAGDWKLLPPAPIAPGTGELSSVWTGKELIVVAMRPTGSAAAAYDPASGRWRQLPAPLGPAGAFLGHYSTAWTGRELLLWGAFDVEAFDPVMNRWRRLPRRPGFGNAGGIVAWTGRELIGWGGGCCGDAFSDGVAYNPATNAWRRLASSPLAGSQHPTGGWTGRELIVLVGDTDPDGKPWPARLARAAAYDPATDRWRRIAPLPAQRDGATGVWDGRELLVVGGTETSRAGGPPTAAAVGYAYEPSANRWRALPPMESGRVGAAAVWTGKRLLVWGGSATAADQPLIPPHGLAYDPTANGWSPLPQAPLRGRVGPTAVWTGRSLIVWGGDTTDCRRGRQCRTVRFADGAALTPAAG